MADATGEVYSSIDLSLRVGEMLLSGGAGAADVAATMMTVTTACGLRGCVIDVNFSTLAVSYQESPDSPPQTHMRTVQHRGFDYGYLAEADQLVRNLATGDVTRAEASQRMNEIRSNKRPYPRWLVTGAVGMMAAGVSLLFRGGPLVVFIAFCAAVLIELIDMQLMRRRIPKFYARVAGAIVAAATAVGVHALDLPANPSLVVTAGIIVLLAGIAFVGAIQDALTGYYVTGAARTFEALLLTGGVIAGITMTLTISQNFGVTMEVTTNTGGLSDLPMQLIGSAITTVAFAVSCQVPRTALLGCGLVGLFAQMLFQLSVAARLGPTAASALAAFGVGVVAYAVGARVRVPPLVIVTTSIVALLPGFTIYKGLFSLLNENIYGMFTLLTAASIAVALASGAILGEYVAQPVAREARRLETRLAGPRLVGPLRPVPRRTQRKARRNLQKQIRAEESQQSREAD